MPDELVAEHPAVEGHALIKVGHWYGHSSKYINNGSMCTESAPGH
jgi:hypothetical protein